MAERGLGLLVGLGRKPGVAEEPPPIEPELDAEEDMASEEADEAATVAAGEVRTAMESGSDADFARALRRFMRIAG